MNLVLFALTALILLYGAWAKENCPRDCSGHGKCAIEVNATTGRHGHYCACYDAYDVLPDCSAKKCNYGLSWASKATAANTAHVSMECANQGMCDRNSGICKCFPGFEGNACDRLACECGEHGTCMTLSQQHDRYLIGSTEGAYSTWDADQTTSCVCDYGFMGPGCNMRMCPKGDDPMSTFTGYKSIKITTSASDGKLAGKFKFTFNGEYMVFDADATYFTSALCKQALEGMPNFGTVSCTRGTVDANSGAEYVIRFKTWPAYPHENTVYSNDGNPAINLFGCEDYSITGGTDAACALADVDASTVKPEYTTCSNRGVCDFATGQCSCFESFYGSSCNAYTYAVREISSALPYDVMGVQTIEPGYDGNLLRLKSAVIGECDRTGSCSDSDFKFVRVTNTSTDAVTEMDGEGNIDMFIGDFNLDKGGLTINSKGLVVSGGLSIMQQGLVIAAGIGVTINTGGLLLEGVGKSITLDGVGGVKAIHGGVAVTGGVSLNSGDLDISGGLMVTQGGMTVEDGININGVGLSVEQSGMKIPLGLTVFSRGVYVYNKISLPYDGFSVNGLGEINGGLVLEEDGVDVRTEGVLVSHSTGLNLPNKLTVSNGITIEDVGLYLFGGMSIQDTGLVITAGMEMVDVGLSVEGGGLRITGGLSVLTDSVSSDMIVQAGVTVKNGGVSISATGLTVETEGLKVTKDGLSIEVEGLVVTGGLSMDWFRPYDLVDFGKIGGIDIEDGATIHDGGLWVLGKGLTISADGLMHEGDSPCVSDVGMKVTGGVTINAGGLTVTGGGISITGGLKVTDSGVSVMDAGLKLEGGLTITGDPDYSLLITGGLTSANALWTAETIDIEADGLTIVDGLTVHNAGVSVDLDGLTITAGGLRIEDIGVESDGNLAVKLGGLTVFTDGLEITAGSISIFEAGLVVSGGLTVNNGGLSVTDFIVSYGTMSVMDGGMTVETDGVVLSGHYRAPREVLANVNGITLADIGLWIATGGVTIGHQGLHTVKGICIHTGGLLIKEVPPETSLRYTHNEGLTISTGGLSITAGGLNIGSSGLTGKKRDGLQITGGVSLETSNLVITAGGLSVHDAGLNVQDGLTINTGGLLDMHNMCIVDVGLAVTGGMTIREDGLMMPATSTGVEVKADGMKVIDGLRSAGVKVTGGLTIPKDGLKVIDGVRIGTLGLRLDGQIRKPKGNGLTLTAGGLRVSSGDVTLASPGNFKLLANNKLTIAEGNDFEINHGLTISTGGIIPGGVAVAGGMAIADLLGVTGTFDLTGGLSVRSGGLSVLAGGISLTADDLDVGDDLMVTAGDVDVDGLMLVNDGVTIQNSGVVVSLGGMTVNNHILVPAAGIQVTGDGLTVNHDGIKVTGGATITGVGVTVTGGFSIASEGLSVLAGGLTVQDGLWLANALAITDGLTATGGIYAATGQGVTVHKGTSGGLQVDTSMFVSGDVKTALGVTITANGLRVTGTSAATDDTVVEITSDLHSSHTLYVARNGVVPNDVTVASGLSVSTGIVVTGGIESDGAGGTNVPMAGMTVFDLGTKVTGGVSIHQVGLDIPQAGLTIASSLWVMDDGLHVTGGFTAYDDGMTITEGGLNVLGGMSVDGGMTIVGSVTTNILRFAADVTVSTVGIKAGGEVCVLTNGMKVETDDMHVEGGVTVVDTGVTIDKGIHVVRKSLYVHDTGLTVAANGVQIGQGGLQFNDGLTVQLGGMRIGAANSPLVNHHLYMHGKLDVQGGEGMSINAGGMRIYGRLTVRDTGLDSTGLLKIGNSLKTVGGGTRPGCAHPGGRHQALEQRRCG